MMLHDLQAPYVMPLSICGDCHAGHEKQVIRGFGAAADRAGPQTQQSFSVTVCSALGRAIGSVSQASQANAGGATG